MLDGLIDEAFGFQNVAQIAVGLQQIGIEADRRAKTFDGFGTSPLLVEDVAQVIVRGGMLGLQLQNTLEAGGRLGNASEIGQQHAHVVVRLNVIGLQPHHVLHGADGQLRAAQRQVGRGQVRVVGKLHRILGDGASNQVDCRGVLPAPMRNDPQQVQRMRIRGLRGQDLAVEPLGVVEPAVAMMFIAQLQGVSSCCHRPVARFSAVAAMIKSASQR